MLIDNTTALSVINNMYKGTNYNQQCNEVTRDTDIWLLRENHNTWLISEKQNTITDRESRNKNVDTE